MILNLQKKSTATHSKQNILEYPRIYDDTFSLQKAMRSMTMKDNLHRVNKKEREK